MPYNTQGGGGGNIPQIFDIDTGQPIIEQPMYGNNFGGGNFGGGGGGGGGGGDFPNTPEGKAAKRIHKNNLKMLKNLPYGSPAALPSQNIAFNIPDFLKNRDLLYRTHDYWAGRSLEDISPTRPMQMEYINALRAGAIEGQPSASERLLRTAVDRNTLQNLALQATAGNQDAGLTNYLIGQQTAQQNREAANAAATLKTQELSQYGSALETLRQQDLATEDFKQKMVTYYLSTGLNLNAAQAAANQALESLLANQYQAAQAIQAQYAIAAEANKQAQQNAWIGAGATVVGAIGAAIVGGGGGGGGTGPIQGPGSPTGFGEVGGIGG